MNIFSWFFRKRAIKKHVRVLGPALRERYGYKRAYTATEVTDTATSLNLWTSPNKSDTRHQLIPSNSSGVR
ncbi:DUF6559 family protein [Marinobacter sp. DUT-3]|uniref:DUF6559 family protein n=1 Tax=Marinobacter sp. DUT-3 TaxID=3412036 RepID=UPI003D17DD3C